ncbi:uncharacterized protein TRUGW13939_01301 [Talaromyces rugulosus]|uniref:Glucose N-acetyltransferase 1 n=1 Tax=Talaromyces rugulosus TaxID=121627 RepID=A0A7H8QJZ0_TALRU|nr:uncharacterized protein TRUGW13939_01301 [Talaromyces rugulosus]QKX54216.1 hypothetical protein TRUGW13939_01301 [Talaromyces rugulosus]
MALVSPKVLRAATIAICLLLVVTLWHFQSSTLQQLPRFSYGSSTGIASGSSSSTSTVTSENSNKITDDNNNAASASLTAAAAGTVDWSRYAYVQYVTNTAYLCNSVMLFEILHRLQSKPDRLLMYPSDFSVDTEDDSTESYLLRKARDEYQAKLMPIEVQSRISGDPTWAESYTKLLAFNQTQYDRVLSLDSDSTILQPMDELFLLPSAPVGMPRAYWLDFNDRVLSSQLVLIEPSEFEFNRISASIASAGSTEYDMEIFRSKKHADYLGNSEEAWDPEKVLNEAKFLHFSDWPVPKPWIAASPSVIQEKQPTCDLNPATGQEDDCRARDIWLGVYEDFAKRRKNVCDLSVERKVKRSSPTNDSPEQPSRYEYIV